MALKNLTGQRFGRLTALSMTEKSHVDSSGKSHGTRWLCRCDCGVEKTVLGASLTRGHTSSCGCYRIDVQPTLRRTHGLSKTWEYRLLMSIKDRCLNPSNKKFYLYGGRGIGVFQGWLDDPASFIYYIKRELGPRPAKGFSLDRKNNEVGYEPGNLRWATAHEQCMNQRTNRLITFNGVTQHLVEWARDAGITMGHMSSRLETWPIADALLTPKGVRRPSVSSN